MTPANREKLEAEFLYILHNLEVTEEYNEFDRILTIQLRGRAQGISTALHYVEEYELAQLFCQTGRGHYKYARTLFNRSKRQEQPQ